MVEFPFKALFLCQVLKIKSIYSKDFSIPFCFRSNSDLNTTQLMIVHVCNLSFEKNQ